jgi:hypothetical protein
MVYVDDFASYNPLRYNHMVADTIDELHKMALKLYGKHVKKLKFRPEHTTIIDKHIGPYYRISEYEKQLAIENGAKVMGCEELVRHLKATKAEGWSND